MGLSAAKMGSHSVLRTDGSLLISVFSLDLMRVGQK